MFQQFWRRPAVQFIPRRLRGINELSTLLQELKSKPKDKMGFELAQTLELLSIGRR